MPDNNSWIKTYTGRRFDVLNPDPDQIDIEDIAHALSNQCRYGGHSRQFYSVAEHSVYVSDICSGYAKLGALLHDASEAYLIDIPRPIKYTSYLLGYRDLEKRVQDTIDQKFVSFIDSNQVKYYDKLMLQHEVYQLMLDPDDYGFEPPTSKIVFMCWSPKEAKEKFLERFYKLTKPST